MYRTLIISVTSTIGLVFLVLAFGAAAGYATCIVTKKIIMHDRNLKQSNLVSKDFADPNQDTNNFSAVYIAVDNF
jgi:hypothetical protein